jgi:hypothetical protein
MPNTPVRAAAEGMPAINRRYFLANAAVAATATIALVETASADTSEVSRLIEAHKTAHAVFTDGCGVSEDAERAYFDRLGSKYCRTEIFVPLSIGGAYSFHYGTGPWAHEEVEGAIKEIKAQYARAIQSMSPASKLDNESVTALQAKLSKACKADCRRVQSAVRTELKNRRAAGVEAAQQAYEAISEAEREALRAICSYRCSKMEEIAERARYLAEIAGPQDMQPEMFEALLASMAGAPASGLHS